MRDAEALAIISASFGRAIGAEGAVKVSSVDDGRAPVAALSAARALGSGGRVLLVAVDGWGAAFERRRILKHLVADVHADRDDLVSSVLERSRDLIEQQNARRVRAAAFDIGSPLDQKTFADLRRLRIDIATARALHLHLGGDAAVRDWFTVQLERWCAPIGGGRVRSVLRVHGFTVSVPFTLDPLALFEDAPLANCARWLGNEIWLTLPADMPDVEVHAAAERAARSTPLADRAIVSAVTWPPAVTEEDAKSLRVSASHRSSAETSAPARSLWLITFERRMISLLEAFD